MQFVFLNSSKSYYSVQKDGKMMTAGNCDVCFSQKKKSLKILIHFRITKVVGFL